MGFDNFFVTLDILLLCTYMYLYNLQCRLVESLWYLLSMYTFTLLLNKNL